MNKFLAVLVFAAAPAGAAPAPKAAPPMERIADMYVEARVAHILVEERAKRVIGLKPFDSLGRHHADYQQAVAFLESRAVVQPSLQAAALALPKTLPPSDWAKYFLALTQKELQHAEEDRLAARGYITSGKSFGPEVAGLVPFARLETRTLALFGENPYGPVRKIVDALAAPLPKEASLPFTDPAYPLYVRAQARILKRLVAAYAHDSDRLVAGRASLSEAEAKRIFGSSIYSFELKSKEPLRALETDLKVCPPFQGAGAVHAAAALKDLQAAAAEAARARAALDAVKARVEQIDAAILAKYTPDPDDDYGPNEYMSSFRSWVNDLQKIEKGCSDAAAAIAAKLPAKP